jgi:cytochrome c551/c552
MRKLLYLAVCVLLFGLVACGGSTPQGGGGNEAGGDAASGEALFAQTLVGTQPGCVTCHSLEAGVVVVGPSLAKIGDEAGARVSGQSADQYLKRSIVAPNEHIAEGFAANLMPATYGSELSEQEINDLIAYMLTLK